MDAGEPTRSWGSSEASGGSTACPGEGGRDSGNGGGCCALAPSPCIRAVFTCLARCCAGALGERAEARQLWRRFSALWASAGYIPRRCRHGSGHRRPMHARARRAPGRRPDGLACRGLTRRRRRARGPGWTPGPWQAGTLRSPAELSAHVTEYETTAHAPRYGRRHAPLAPRPPGAATNGARSPQHIPDDAVVRGRLGWAALAPGPARPSAHAQAGRLQRSLLNADRLVRAPRCAHGGPRPRPRWARGRRAMLAKQ